MKRAKNATFLFKPDALRLGEGQMSSFWLLSLRLSKLEIVFEPLPLSFISGNQCFGADFVFLLCLTSSLLALLSISTKPKKMGELV